MAERITITGAGGMLGRDLTAALAGRPVTPLDRLQCDVTDRAATLGRILESQPGVVVHLAAFTKVNECERNPARAMEVNETGTRHVAEAVNAAGARLVYISTDYVFDGRKRSPYVEDDAPGPLGVYGRSKLAGERCASAAPGALILRCGWLFGHGGRNFVEAILDQARRGQPLRVVADQTGCPTWTADLAAAIVRLMDLRATGVIHVPGGGFCTWHEFATAIVQESGLRATVEPIASADLDPGAAPRPAWSVLSDARLRSLGVAPLPHWREALRGYLHARRS
jgi:dTDP-4-dehydrorhamnose reductase